MAVRVIAIDWSGAKKNARKKIWLAEVINGQLVRLESNRDRNQVVQHLIEEAQLNSEMIVGFDFAFSCPAWFVEKYHCSSAPEFWSIVERNSEQWLQSCPPPFWGRKGTTRPSHLELFRRTEQIVSTVGHGNPKSTFQIGGAGAVGTGSLRGMPLLRHLREKGFSIWPFDTPKWPYAVEIYPRLLTGSIVKSNSDHRHVYLAAHYSQLSDKQRRMAASTEDAFDATVSALEMTRYLSEFNDLKKEMDRQILLEGMIWYPRGSKSAPN